MVARDTVDAPPERVEIRRSARRKRTVTARVEGDRIVVLMPAGLSAEQEQRHVSALVDKLRRGHQRRRLKGEDLNARAGRLSREHLGGRAVPSEVKWVTNQKARWGSCSPDTGRIRISSMLDGMPGWVVDAVLVHELAHLLVADHGPRFQELVRRYPRYAEASAFLDGVSWARGNPGGALESDDVGEPDDGDAGNDEPGA